MRNPNALTARGTLVCVGWRDWELEMLRGVMVEHDNGTSHAFRDCAQTLCRRESAVEHKAKFLREMDRKKMALARMPLPPPMSAEPEKPLIRMPVRLDPMPEPVAKATVRSWVSSIAPPSREMLMGGRAPGRRMMNRLHGGNSG